MNILLITSDQQQMDTLGILNPEIKTPNLDRLAKEGACYTRTYCPNPTCTPTRASLITGQYPSQHGAWTLGMKLPESALTLGDVLRENGYTSALDGKAHFQPLASTEEFPSLEAYPILQDLEFWKNFKDRFYGFDSVELARNHTDEAHVGQHYAIWMEEKGLKDWRKYFREPTGTKKSEDCAAWEIPEEFHYDAWIAERVNAKLEEYSQNNQPFFLWASFFDPHPDYIVPEPWFSMYPPEELSMPDSSQMEWDKLPPHFKMTQDPEADFSEYRESGYGIHGMGYHCQDINRLRKYKSAYYGMISMMDKYIGKILDKVDQLGMKEDTLIIFTSDHGHFIGEHGLCAKGPLMYEELLKAPFIIRGKGIKQGIYDTMQSLVDFAPSILDSLGINVPRVMTGISQYPVWCGQKESVRDHIICEHHHEPNSINVRTYVDERYKITIYQGHDYGEIYDLKNDSGENHNLWENVELRAELLLKYASAELEKEVRWMPRIAVA